MFKYLLSFVFIYSLINSSLYPIKTLAEWAYSFVVWDGYTYVVSDDYVTEIDIEIGTVTIYASFEGTFSGNFSNAYKVGTKYYSINGVSTNDAIAIQEQDGKYRRANKIGKYAEVLKVQENNEKIRGFGSNNQNIFESNYSILIFLILLIFIWVFRLLKRK